MKKVLSVAIAFVLFVVSAGHEQANAAPLAANVHDGQHDFDWELGNWTTHVRVLRNPLSGEAPVWATYEGTSVVKPLMYGRANFVELAVKGPTGAIEGGSLRLYNPKARQWSLNYASLRGGVLTAPVFGAFDSAGRATFVGQDQLDGRLRVRCREQQSREVLA